MNKRGNFILKLGEQSLTMRPTLEAMADFEDESGTEVTTVLQNISTRLPGIRVVLAAVTTGVRATFPEGQKHKAPSREEIGDMIQAAGLNDVIPQIISYLTEAVASDKQLEKIRAGKLEAPAHDG